MCIATSAETDLVVDVVGYVPDPLSLVTAYQMRLLDTRGGGPRDGTFDGRFLGTGRLAAGATLELTVGGRAVIADAAGVLLNVTVVGPSTAGFLTVFPCGQTRPRASNLNYRAGTIVANAVLASLGTGGNVCLYSSAETDLVVDLSAHAAPTNSLTTVVPARLAETRAGPGGTIDDLFAGIGARPAGSTLELAVTGRAGVPAGAHAVVLN